MNVLIVAPSFPPDKTVASVRMNSLYQYLLSRHHTVYVLTNKKEQLSDMTYYVDVESYGGIKKFKDFRINQKRYVSTFRRILKEHPIDIVVVSGGPFYTFGIAQAAKMCGVPCILDFRDPWTFDIRGWKDMLSPMRAFTRLIQKKYERQAICAASAVVTVTPRWKDRFVKNYPAQIEKFHLIENGFDDSLLAQVHLPEKNKLNSPLVLGVFGKLFYYTDLYSKVFLDAMKETNIQVLQIGNREKCTNQYLKQRNIDIARLQDTGFLPYTAGITTLGQADAFLIIDIRKDALGTKIYDYIWCNRPILYVGPQDTELARLVDSFDNGFVCSNASQVVAAIEKIQNKKLNSLGDNLQPQQFGRSVQNKKWEVLLKKFV